MLRQISILRTRDSHLIYSGLPSAPSTPSLRYACEGSLLEFLGSQEGRIRRGHMTTCSPPLAATKRVSATSVKTRPKLPCTAASIFGKMFHGSQTPKTPMRGGSARARSGQTDISDGAVSIGSEIGHPRVSIVAGPWKAGRRWRDNLRRWSSPFGGEFSLLRLSNSVWGGACASVRALLPPNGGGAPSAPKVW